MLLALVRDVDPIVKLLGNWLNEINVFSIIIRILLAVVLGSIIGFERTLKKHEAGFRTNILVCIGAMMTTFCNQFIFELTGTGDLARLGQGVISGVGFLGAGTILLTSRNQIRGLTTAAGLWACACLGICIGLGFYTLAIFADFAIALVLYSLPRLESIIDNHTKYLTLHIEFDEKDCIKDFMTFLRSHNMKIYSVDRNLAYATNKLNVYSILVKRNINKQLPPVSQDELVAQINKLDYVFFCEKIN